MVAILPLMPNWTFLTNHAHVILCVTNDPDATLREIAAQVGITERAAHRIVVELESEGVLNRVREGRRNHYQVNTKFPLRHKLEQHCKVKQLLQLLSVRGKRRP